MFNITAFQIHGRNLSTDNLDDLQTASGFQANRATRLWELWFQQTFNGADLKIGQQSLDQEFLISAGASAFINTALGWPVVPSFGQYAGSPAYPLSSLGVRLRLHPTPSFTLLGGVFDDNPAGGPFNNDSQLRGATQSGTEFSLNTGALFIGEMQWATNQPTRSGPTDRLPGTYKLGFWFDSGNFPNGEFPTGGQLSAVATRAILNPLLRHDYSLYAVADQTVWQPDPKGARALGLFARLMGAPSDRNLIDLAVNAGAILRAPLPDRDNDTFGLAYGLARISSSSIRIDQQLQAFTAGYNPIRASESLIEVTYQAQIAPWWQVQPDFQYVFLPGAGIANPIQPGRRIGNEAVLGVRTNITF